MVDVIETDLRPDYMPDIDTPICVGFIGDVLTCIYRANDWLYTVGGKNVTSLFYLEDRGALFIYFD